MNNTEGAPELGHIDVEASFYAIAAAEDGAFDGLEDKILDELARQDTWNETRKAIGKHVLLGALAATAVAAAGYYSWKYIGNSDPGSAFFALKRR